MGIRMNKFKAVANLVKEDLVRRYGFNCRVFLDGDFKTAKSTITPDLHIVLDLDKVENMVDGIRCICHEYCHCLRAHQAETDTRLREFHEFYLNECLEYRDHEETELGFLVYRYSLLELDARAFEETFGTVYTDHYFEVLSPSQLREAYVSGGVRNLVQLIRHAFHLE